MYMLTYGYGTSVIRNRFIVKINRPLLFLDLIISSPQSPPPPTPLPKTILNFSCCKKLFILHLNFLDIKLEHNVN